MMMMMTTMMIDDDDGASVTARIHYMFDNVRGDGAGKRPVTIIVRSRCGI